MTKPIDTSSSQVNLFRNLDIGYQYTKNIAKGITKAESLTGSAAALALTVVSAVAETLSNIISAPIALGIGVLNTGIRGYNYFFANRTVTAEPEKKKEPEVQDNQQQAVELPKPKEVPASGWRAQLATAKEKCKNAYNKIPAFPNLFASCRRQQKAAQ